MLLNKEQMNNIYKAMRENTSLENIEMVTRLAWALTTVLDDIPRLEKHAVLDIHYITGQADDVCLAIHNIRNEAQALLDGDSQK